jgi:hypothetical protein
MVLCMHGAMKRVLWQPYTLHFHMIGHSVCNNKVNVMLKVEMFLGWSHGTCNSNQHLKKDVRTLTWVCDQLTKWQQSVLPKIKGNSKI